MHTWNVSFQTRTQLPAVIPPPIQIFFLTVVLSYCMYWLVTWLLSLVKLNLVSSDINLVHSFWVLYDVPGMIIPHFIFVSLLLDIICMIMNLLYIFSLAHICIFPRGKSQKVDRWTIYIRAYTVLSWFDSFVSGKDSFLAL